MIKIESYKDEIDANTKTLDNFIKHSQESLYEMRQSIENQQKAVNQEIRRLEDKIKGVTSILDPLPNKVEQCEALCDESKQTSAGLKRDMKAIQDTNIKLQDKKTDLDTFLTTKENLEIRLMDLENNFDKTKDRCDSLECWIDIYLPLRNQHQITETVRECLTRKGKYMLGIADGLICNKLRERVFTDVGRP